MITVVGMGRSDGDLTLDGLKTIRSADAVVVKTSDSWVAKAVAAIRNDAVFCDDEMNSAKDFDELNESILKKLQSFGKRKVAFCVVGDGSDDSVAQMLDGAATVSGVSLQTAVTVGKYRAGTVAYTAQEICSAKRLLPVPTVVTGIFDKYIAGEVQLKLQQIFDYDNEVFLSNGKAVKQIRLNELTKQHYDAQTCVYALPRELAQRKVFEYYDCADILAVLRGEGGCPWDREQTHKSIVKNVIEEAYDLANALENEDVPNIVEELGDLLMQALFHLEIGEEEGEFEPSAVYTALCRKLIDRHPHVFGDVKVGDAAESLDVWTEQKMKEHKIKSTAQNVLDVPRGMSALMRSQKVQSRASKGAFDFKNQDQILDKFREELNEFLNAKEADRQMEGGDLLFVAVNLLRFNGVDAETALLMSTDKFAKRVAECERILTEQGRVLKDLPQEQFDEVWAEAKRNVG
ncbi:MAG: nucleoside triphosphate pyrophosphohydrolase [Corallococcus sp.]|nr:nucleoside triphosphate pyrophosphohydrolase [Corallococcus sp.]